MSSFHVVVIDKTARRHQIKVGPETLLNEVFRQACKKTGADPSTHGLKHGQRTLDLSLPMRYANLSPGAKLELVQLSKSSTRASNLVTVALQMMDASTNTPRLTEKFPNTTSIWAILRHFESKSRSLGVRGIEITEVPVALTSDAGGSGRLFYSMPVVQIVNRELANLDDLQITLAEMGYMGGTALLRLKLRPTQIPLEEALMRIAGFGPQAVALPEGTAASAPLVEEEPNQIVQGEAVAQSNAMEGVEQSPTVGPVAEGSISTSPLTIETSAASKPAPSHTPMETAPAQTEAKAKLAPDSDAVARPVTVFAPSNTTVPKAATLSFDEAEYDLTIAQARQFQANLVANSRPQRLLSNAELAEKERLAREKKEKVEEIEVRVRFPDQMIVQTKFKAVDTAADLYTFVRSTLKYPSEPFYLYLTPPVRRIPETGGRLVLDCQFTSRILVNFSWAEDAGIDAIAEGTLRAEYLKQAQALEVPKEVLELKGDDEEEEERGKGKKKTWGGMGGKGAGGEGSSGGKVPRWLKLGKK